MGIWYEFAVVHGRALVWWTDNDSRPHEVWLDPVAAKRVMSEAEDASNRMQKLLHMFLGA